MEDQCMLVINKVDKRMSESDKEIAASPYRELGLWNILMMSAKNGANFNELEEVIYMIANSQSYKKYDPKYELIVSFVWRPNVGKSTLLNTFAKADVSKVSDKPWTTLDYISEEVSYGKTIFKLVDTAWIRKQTRIEWLEKIALAKTLKMLAYYKPIVVLMWDAVEWPTKQDLHLV